MQLISYVPHLLAHVLEASDAADERRTRDLQQARAERTRAETGVAKLLELIETEQMSARDPVLAKRLGDHRTRIASLNTTIESLERQLHRGTRRITPEIVQRFGENLREKITADDPALRKAYVKMIIGQVGLDNDQIIIAGSKTALENALVQGDRAPPGLVPSFDREWCTEQDAERPDHPHVLLEKVGRASRGGSGDAQDFATVVLAEPKPVIGHQRRFRSRA